VFTKPANYFKNLFKKQVEVFNDLVDRIAIEKGTDPLKEKYYTLDAIDAKCSGLLTHVSLMITATVFLYTDAKQGSVTKDFLLCEITVYILIALSLLYCLNLRRIPSGKIKASSRLYRKHAPEDCSSTDLRSVQLS
jgi:hypothetical protein